MADNSVLTRLVVNGPTFNDTPVLILAVVLVLALSGVVSYTTQQRQDARDTDKKRKLTRKLSNMGMTTLATEVPTNLSIPVSVLTVEGHLTKEDYVERLRARLLHDVFFLRWRSVVRGDYKTGVYKFVELPGYDVSRNVVEHTVEDGETTMSYVESALVNKPMDFDKPLWEMHVIHDPKSTPGVTSVGWKIHHCLGDGASIATAMAKLSDQSEMFDAMLEKRAQAKKTPKAKKPRKPVSHIVKDILIFLYVVVWSIGIITWQMGALVFRREPQTVFKRPGSNYKRLSYNMLYSVTTTKAVGKHFRATVNDVMLNVVAGAMRKTMIAQGESVAPTLVVRCAIPVDMRSSTEVIRTTSNRFSSLVIDLPLGVADSAQRLHRVTAAMNEAKNSLEKYFVYWSSHLISMLPAPLIRFVVHFTTARISVATTNVRASAAEMDLCGNKVSGFYGFVPPPPYVNLGVAILSMGDNLGLNVLVDPGVGVDAKQFLEFAKEEFTALQAAVAAKEANAEELDEKKTNTPKTEQNETTPTVPTTVTELAIATAPSTEKKSKIEKNQNDSFASAEILDEVQKFLTLHIAENRCSSHTKEINEFMAQHLNEKQRKRYFALLVERIVQHFAQEASTKGEEVSVDVQSNICLIEQMFLTLGRRSPLEDMYTAEEEEMLDLLFHSNSSNDLPINT
ncbi:hypothetical protein BBJ29_007980 [Phytophthora kernoviae]|uniref:Uncharacterized protein n=1 Tax=Phytophthora kernoviae TaxID=325452 RepID=A0A3F2RHT2_9STRA|nr:hypothetical protein BBJ29_007980 [Phytophthora kernoviae]RLN57233.1 hypothetical protein BBP00_00007609 [Phytophthora kernoviae]